MNTTQATTSVQNCLLSDNDTIRNIAHNSTHHGLYEGEMSSTPVLHTGLHSAGASSGIAVTIILLGLSAGLLVFLGLSLVWKKFFKPSPKHHQKSPSTVFIPIISVMEDTAPIDKTFSIEYEDDCLVEYPGTRAQGSHYYTY